MSMGGGQPSPLFVGLSGNLRQTGPGAVKRLFRPDDVLGEGRSALQVRVGGGQKPERLGGRCVGQGGGGEGGVST